MKKFLAKIFLFLFLIGVMMPTLGFGAPPQTPAEKCQLKHTIDPTASDPTKQVKSCISSADPTTYIQGSKGASVVGLCCAVDAIYTITDWVFYVIFVLSMAMIVIGGGIYITAAGDPAKTESGRNIIKYSIIGLIIGLLAKMFPFAVRMLTGL